MTIIKNYKDTYSLKIEKIKDLKLIFKELEELISKNNERLRIESEVFFDLLNLKDKEITDKLTSCKIDGNFNIFYTFDYFSTKQLKKFLSCNNTDDFDFILDKKIILNKENIDKISEIKLNTNTKNILFLATKLIIDEYYKNKSVLSISQYDDIIEFIYEQDLKFILEHNKKEIDKELDSNLSLKNKIGQKYLNRHNIDLEIINKFNDNSSSFYTLKQDLRKECIDICYIADNLKHYNMRNLEVFGAHFGYEREYSYKGIVEHNKFNDKLFNILKIKFSKYILNNKDSAMFIMDYYGIK